MSTTAHAPVTPETSIARAGSHLAHFTTRWIPPHTAVVTADGEIDAANAQQIIDYALDQRDRINRLVLDMREINFIGTSGFSALHALNVRCAGEAITWASVPSTAVTRLLSICDPDSALPFYGNIDTALSAVQDDPPPLLELISQAG